MGSDNKKARGGDFRTFEDVERALFPKAYKQRVIENATKNSFGVTLARESVQNVVGRGASR